MAKMFDKICEKFLPRYIPFGHTKYWLAIWSAPVRYAAVEGLAARNDTAWQALRITVRQGENDSLVFTVKRGVI